jgi:hypothetical protein
MFLYYILDGILLVLGDTKDEDYPIYRTCEASDDDADGTVDTGFTLTTALFSVQFGGDGDREEKAQSSVTLYLSNPKTNKDVHIKKPIWIE